MQKMKADDIALGTFKPGDLVRWICAWQFPLVDAPPRDNTVLAITDDGMVWLEGRHGGERAQQWGCPPDQLVHREPTKSQGEPAQERQDEDELPECSACGETCHWNDEADRDDIDGVLCNPCAQRIASEFLAESEPDLKRIRAIVERDARKRHGDREGEPSWGVIADCVLAHVSQHRQAREILGVPEQVTLDQYVAETSQYLRDFEISLVDAGKWDPYPELPLNLLAREIVAQAERWRIDAEHYRGEASNATAIMVESLSAEVARLTGEVAATQAEAKRQIDSAVDRYQVAEKTLARLGWPGGDPIAWARKITSDHAEPTVAKFAALEADVLSLVRDNNRLSAARDDIQVQAAGLAADLSHEADECYRHNLRSPATALRRAAEFLNTMVPSGLAEAEEALRAVLQAQVTNRLPQGLTYLLHFTTGFVAPRPPADTDRDPIEEGARVFSAASSVEALHLRLEEADRHLARLQGDLRHREEALREETRKVIEYSELVDHYKLAMARVGVSAAAVSAALDQSLGATALRHTLAAQLRAAAKTANAWEEAAIREWAPLAPDYHDGDGTVTAAIEGPYLEHRLVMAWRGQVQRMADNLSADAQRSPEVLRG